MHHLNKHSKATLDSYVQSMFILSNNFVGVAFGQGSQLGVIPMSLYYQGDSIQKLLPF